MKKHFLVPFAVVLSLFAFSACSNSNDDPTGPGSLTLTIDKPLVTDNSSDVVKFTVKGDDLGDYTQDAEYYINTEKISGATFNPTGKSGAHTVYAVYNGVKSNEVKLYVVGENLKFNNIILSANASKIYAKYEQVDFTVTGTIAGVEEVVPLTEISKILVDGTEITGSSYVPTETKDYTISAKFFDQVSNSITVQAIGATAFVHKVLVEDFTGAWCPNCPRIIYAIEQTHKQTDKVLVAALHRGNPVGSKQSVDPWNIDASALEKAICAKFGIDYATKFGYPFAAVNRTYGDFNLDVNKVIGTIQNSSPYGIAFSSTLGATSGSIDINVAFLEGLEDAKCVVYVLEDDLVYNQANNTSYFGGGSILKDFVHKDVVRAVASNIVGTAIPASESVKEKRYKTTFEVSYKSEDINKLKVMVILLDKDGSVVNVQAGPANQKITLEAI